MVGPMAVCARCKQPTMEVATTVGGQDLTMVSCSRCDTREWRRGDDIIDLDEVLDLTAEASPRKRQVADDEERPATRP